MSEADGPSAARGVAVTLGGQAGKFLVQIVSLFVLSRLIAPESFGLFAMIMAIIGVANVLGDFGLSLAAIQSRTLSESERTSLFLANSGIGLLFGILAWTLAVPIASLYGEPRLIAVTQALAVVFVFNGLIGQFRVELTRSLRFRRLAEGEVLSQVTGLAVAMVCALQGLEYWSLVVQQIVIAAVLLIYAVFTAGWRPRRFRRGVSIRRFVNFGASTTATQVVNYVSSNVDSVAIGRFLGAAPLGIYNRAFQIFMLPLQQIASPLTRAVLPVLSRKAGEVDFARYLYRLQIGLVYSVVGLLIVLVGVGDSLVIIVLGDSWRASGPVLRILAIGGIFQALGYLYYWICLATARMRELLLCEVVGRAALVVLVVGATPLGIQWTAAAYSFGLFLIWAITTVFGVRRIPGVALGQLLGVGARALITYTVSLLVGLWMLHVSGAGLNPMLAVLLFVGVLVVAVLCSALVPAVRRDYLLAIATARSLFSR